MRTLKAVIVEAPYFCCDQFGMESGSRFAYPKVERKYIEILATCLVCPRTAQQIFGVRNPLCHQLRDLCRAGYMQRYELTVPNGLPGPNPYYYQTTLAGKRLIAEAIGKSVDKLIAEFNGGK